MPAMLLCVKNTFLHVGSSDYQATRARQRSVPCLRLVGEDRRGYGGADIPQHLLRADFKACKQQSGQQMERQQQLDRSARVKQVAMTPQSALGGPPRLLPPGADFKAYKQQSGQQMEWQQQLVQITPVKHAAMTPQSAFGGPPRLLPLGHLAPSTCASLTPVAGSSTRTPSPSRLSTSGSQTPSIAAKRMRLEKLYMRLQQQCHDEPDTFTADGVDWPPSLAGNKWKQERIVRKVRAIVKPHMEALDAPPARRIVL